MRVHIQFSSDFFPVLEVLQFHPLGTDGDRSLVHLNQAPLMLELYICHCLNHTKQLYLKLKIFNYINLQTEYCLLFEVISKIRLNTARNLPGVSL